MTVGDSQLMTTDDGPWYVMVICSGQLVLVRLSATLGSVTGISTAGNQGRLKWRAEPAATSRWMKNHALKGRAYCVLPYLPSPQC